MKRNKYVHKFIKPVVEVLYQQYRVKAKARGYVFTLTLDEFKTLTTSVCVYCGREPEQVFKTSKDSIASYIYNGIDRVDNTIGYETRNCVPCCGECNIAKGTRSCSDFLKHIERIHTHQHGTN